MDNTVHNSSFAQWTINI